MTELAGPVRSAAGTLALRPYATVALSGAAVLGAQLLTMTNVLSWAEEQPIFISRMATIFLAGTFIPAAQRLLARARIAVHSSHERSLSAGHAFAFAGARSIRSGGSAGTGQQRSPPGRRDTPNKRIEQTRRRLYGRLRNVSARCSCAVR
jgi:hypothetical protein